MRSWPHRPEDDETGGLRTDDEAFNVLEEIFGRRFALRPLDETRVRGEPSLYFFEQPCGIDGVEQMPKEISKWPLRPGRLPSDSFRIAWEKGLALPPFRKFISAFALILAVNATGKFLVHSGRWFS